MSLEEKLSSDVRSILSLLEQNVGTRTVEDHMKV